MKTQWRKELMGMENKVRMKSSGKGRMKTSDGKSVESEWANGKKNKEIRGRTFEMRRERNIIKEGKFFNDWDRNKEQK